MNWKTFSLVVTLALPLAAVAHGLAAAPRGQQYDPVVMTAAFMRWHPDLEYRLFGTEAFKRQDYVAALGYFRRAAYYADKPSQAMLGEMYLQGQGVTADPALAYAWMALAAERGYPDFIAIAERYRQALDPGQREQARKHTRALEPRYADAAAKPRIAAQLRRGRSTITGSRTGKAENLTINVTSPGGSRVILDGAKFYSPRYWDPVQYQQWHDQAWNAPGANEVEVGKLQPVQSPAPTPASGTPMP